MSHKWMRECHHSISSGILVNVSLLKYEKKSCFTCEKGACQSFSSYLMISVKTSFSSSLLKESFEEVSEEVSEEVAEWQ